MKPPFIIAEAGVNHNGSVDLARQLIDAAVAAGADAVKFQTFSAKKLAGKLAPKAEYQKQTTSADESQLAMIEKLELDRGAHLELKTHCREKGIEFMSTPFDEGSVDLLVEAGVGKLKIASGNITDGPLLLKAGRTGLPVILSTGMATLGEIEDALGVLAFAYLREEKPGAEGFRSAYASTVGQEVLRGKVTLMHCTSEYPAAAAEANLNVLATLRRAFGLPVGYSDHTEGIAVAIAAAALRAVVIEKHFTLDRRLPGPDHLASLEPAEFGSMVQALRQVSAALGRHQKVPGPSEVKNLKAARKSLCAAAAISQGELFTGENLTAKRPGSGVSPMDYWDWLGKKASKDYQPDETIGP